MDLEFLNKLDQLKLNSDEDAGFPLEPADITSSKEECGRSLIGKLFGEKLANFTGLKNSLSTIWNLQGPFQTLELGPNKYQFVFSTIADRDKVLRGKVWLFEAQYLILKPWEADANFNDASFNKVPLWVQIWNLPFHWISKETGRRFSRIFEDVLDVLIPETGSKQGRSIKVLAVINLDKPVLRGTKISCEGKSTWVAFKYENLANFCFYCGKIGHAERNCELRHEDGKKGCLSEGQYGSWLRANINRLLSKKNSPTAADLAQTWRKPAPPLAADQHRAGNLELQSPVDVPPERQSPKMSSRPVLAETTQVPDLDKPLKDHEHICPPKPSFLGVNEQDISTIKSPESSLLYPRTCDTSPQSVQPDWMPIDSEKEDLYTLISVPMTIQQKENILQDKNTSPATLTDPVSPAKGSGERPKRRKLKGKENNIPVADAHNPDSSDHQSKKRSWQLLDEPDDCSKIETAGKKLKSVLTSTEADAEKVVVASLNWPQPYQ